MNIRGSQTQAYERRRNDCPTLNFRRWSNSDVHSTTCKLPLNEPKGEERDEARNVLLAHGKKIGAKINYTLDNVVRQLLSEYQVSLSPQAYVQAKITHKKMCDQSAACCLNRLGLVKTGTANGVTGRGAVMHTG